MSGMGAVDNKRGSAALPVAALRSAVLPRAALPASGLWRSGGGGGYWPGGTPAAIRSACVLWYDIARQGCTNESMAADPTLRDLSGNGHDAACHNFAWGGMSGIGGYDFNLLNFKKLDSQDECTDSLFRVVTPANAEDTNEWLLTVSSTIEIPEMRVRFTGVGDVKGRVYFRYIAQADAVGISQYNINSDGEYTLPKSYGLSASVGQIGLVGRVQGMTVELLPAYPNALVGDGVNDYAKAEVLPLLDKERGYTVIAKRKHLGGIQACLASRRNSDNTDGAFVFELKSSANSYRCDSFNTLTQLSAFEEFDITCQTSQRYNDTAIGIGDAPDNGVLNLFVLYNSYFGKIALYSFLLFDRDLTAGEIAWVRENLLGDAPRLLLEDGGGISLEGGGQLLLEG